MKLQFVIMGDSNFFPSIALSVEQINHFHCGASIYLYDWGFTEGEARYLKTKKSIIYVDWRQNFISDPLSDTFMKAVSRRARANSSSIYSSSTGWLVGLAKEIVSNKHRRREWLWAQKPYCLRHLAKTWCPDNFVFLDGDAFLMNNVDELTDGAFDLGLTLRRKSEINFKKGYCQVINSGVLAFTAGPVLNLALIEAWIEMMKKTSDECFTDQTSLTRMVLGYTPTEDIRPGQLLELETPIRTAIVELLDCESYNYNWIEEGVDKNVNKIVHFKGGRHGILRFVELTNELGLAEKVRDILVHHKSL